MGKLKKLTRFDIKAASRRIRRKEAVDAQKRKTNQIIYLIFILLCFFAGLFLLKHTADTTKNETIETICNIAILAFCIYGLKLILKIKT